jgi:hypothetical protein
VDGKSRKSVLQSPWYWVYAFCAVGLALLLLVDQRSTARQLNEERQFQARQRAKQIERGQEPTIEPSTPEHRIVSLRPLFLMLAVAALVGWAVVWYRHFYRRHEDAPRNSEEEDRQ